ncbi:MAG: hypothetical protein HY013_06675 [Candidatus Solibacter usitatus]|nr:hypothetical protein [Candidatus Solibacter usitatus]
MLTAVLCCSDRELARWLEEALPRGVAVVGRLDGGAEKSGLASLLRSVAPDILFAGLDSQSNVNAVAEEIHSAAPGAQIVALHRTCDPDVLLRTLRAGIREFLAPPFEPRTLDEMVLRVEAARRASVADSRPHGVYAFLPAKPGVGATTIAAQVHLALSRRKDCNALLMDLDLNAGLIGFMLQLQGQHSVLEAVDSADQLDEDMWTQLVAKLGNLDVLLAGNYRRDVRLDPERIRSVIQSARRHYRSVAMDLSGLMEQFSLEALREATRIYLVCTAESPCIYLARKKLDLLRGLSLEHTVGVILNRCSENAARAQSAQREVEKALGRPVLAVFPNDYRTVHRSLVAAKPVDRNTRLGKSFSALASAMLPEPKTPPEARGGFRGLLALRRAATL